MSAKGLLTFTEDEEAGGATELMVLFGIFGTLGEIFGGIGGTF